MRINPKKLEIAMATKGFNFIDLARESGVSRASLSYINSGKSCKAQTGGKIAQALNVSVERLIEEDQPQRTQCNSQLPQQ